jgi:hypothetical protein
MSLIISEFQSVTAHHSYSRLISFESKFLRVAFANPKNYLYLRKLENMHNLKVEYKPTSTLVAFANNARQHSAKQISELAAGIKEFGFYNPIIIDEANEIIAGHGRLMAAQSLGIDKVPVIRLSKLSEKQKRALRLYDNKVASKSTWDLAKLADELSALAEADFDLSLTAFDENELDSLLAEDSSVLPLDFGAPAMRDEPETGTGKGREEPKEVSGELQEIKPTPKPKATDDNYSVFELVMLHENKTKLVDVLNDIKRNKDFDKIEDALMDLVNSYGEQ